MKYIKAFTTFSKKVVPIALALLMLTACGANADSEIATETIPQYTLPPIIQEAVPAEGGELFFPIPDMTEASQALNPLKVKNVELYNMFSLIYESPLRIGEDGRAQPELAETWSVNEDGTVWTFNLRKGVQWQGGYGEFTAADVLYTIGLLMTYTAEDSLYVTNKNQITGYYAPDDYTVRITQASPGFEAVYFMTFPVVCKAYCESVDIDSAKPIGTGPYQVTSFDWGEEVSFEPNPVWWKQTPYIPNLTALCYPDHDTAMAAFEQNLLDIITTSSLTVDTYQKYQAVEYKDYLTQYYDCLVPNTNRLFSDVNLRLAVAYALDKRSIVSKAMLNHAVVADYPIPPDSYLSAGSSRMYEHNQQNARDFLALSGWEERDDDGVVEKVGEAEIVDLDFELLIPTNTEESYRYDVAQNIKTQLAQVGMNVEIVEKEPAAYLSDLQNGTFDLALCTFYLDVNPDITEIIGTGGNLNYGYFSDSMMDELLSACNSALNENDLQAAYFALEEHFWARAPHIGLYFRTNALLYDAQINIADSFRDRTLFSTVPQWYIFVEEPEG